MEIVEELNSKPTSLTSQGWDKQNLNWGEILRESTKIYKVTDKTGSIKTFGQKVQITQENFICNSMATNLKA